MTNRLRGVTLIETMLYIGLFSIILMVIMNFMFSTQEATERTNARTSLHQSVEFVNQHISETFKTVQSINDVSSVYNDNNGVISIITGGISNQYTLQNSRPYYNDIPITPNTVSVSSFFLQPVYDSDNITIGVRVTSLLVSKSDSSITEEINLLTVLR